VAHQVPRPVPSSTRDTWLMSGGGAGGGAVHGREYGGAHAPTRPTTKSTTKQLQQQHKAQQQQQRLQLQGDGRYGMAPWAYGREVSQKVWLPLASGALASDGGCVGGGDEPIIIVPSTFLPGCHARFTITVMSGLPFDLEVLA
jgi:hypothetical protein